MSDSCQPQQRNLYQTKFSHLEYRSGAGVSYDEQLRALSWSVSDDVPARAQPSATGYTKGGNWQRASPGAGEPSKQGVNVLDTHGSRTIHEEATGEDLVHFRLSMPSKGFTRPASREHATSPVECAGDAAFSSGRIPEAIRQYSLSLNQTPSLSVLEKRCAALATMGKYNEALDDAKRILSVERSPRAVLRVKDLENYLSTRTNCTTGYSTAHVTLLCNLTPPGLKLWRSTQPSVYTYRAAP